MAKYETRLKGNFDTVLKTLHDSVLNASATASYEDGSDFRAGGMRCAVRVYERYSMMGNNRVSLAMTLVGNGEGDIYLSAITAGGSQAMFFKINTFGEEAFLDTLVTAVERLK